MRPKLCPSLSWILIAATIALSGCGKELATTSTMPSTLTSNSALIANNAGALATNKLGNVPVETPTAPQTSSSNFGDALIVPSRPGSGEGLGDSEAPAAAVADGADYALNHPSVVSNQIIVSIKNTAGYRLSRYAAFTGAHVVQDINVGTHLQVIDLPAGMTVEQGIATYAHQPGVVSAVPNRVYGVTDTTDPNDPYFSKEWGDKQISAPAGWAHNIDASNVMVGVIDTGIDYRHPEFGNRIVKGWNFVNNNADVMDRFGHGTHVAGIIGAEGNNGVGVAGVAWNVKILAVKVLGDNGEGSTAAVVNGIKYAADMGCKVINMSLGSPDTTVDPALSAAIAYANSKGVIVVCAAGNNHGDVGSPANDPGAIAVSSTSKFLWWEYLSWFSNRGSKVEVAAPGGGIWSTVPLDPNETGSTGYGKLSGTSMAAPFVTGEAALIWAKHPDWSASQVHQVIDTAVDHKGSSGRNDHYGFGRINLDKALSM